MDKCLAASYATRICQVTILCATGNFERVHCVPGIELSRRKNSKRNDKRRGCDESSSITAGRQMIQGQRPSCSVRGVVTVRFAKQQHRRWQLKQFKRSAARSRWKPVATTRHEITMFIYKRDVIDILPKRGFFST